MSDFNEKEILKSWQNNAKPWISAVDNNEIESRKLVTNQAILDIVLNQQPKRVLDLGCGEGWLARALGEYGINVHGIDATPVLIEEAKRLGGGSFEILFYEDVAQGRLKPKNFDAAICNFSLLGKASSEQLIQALPNYLTNKGQLFIQTLHPVFACGELPYLDGWREGSWQGFSGEFSKPAPWYFRTLASWCNLLRDACFDIRAVHEPLHPIRLKPVSIIFHVAVS